MAKFKERSQTIIDHIKLGMTFKDACALAGVHESTGYIWLKNPSFSSQCNQAELEYKRSLITTVTKGALSNPSLAINVLARKWSDEWNPVQKHEHSGKVDLVQSMLESEKDGNDTDQAIQSG